MLSIGISDCPPASSFALSSRREQIVKIGAASRIVVDEGCGFHEMSRGLAPLCGIAQAAPSASKLKWIMQPYSPEARRQTGFVARQAPLC